MVFRDVQFEMGPWIIVSKDVMFQYLSVIRHSLTPANYLDHLPSPRLNHTTPPTTAAIRPSPETTPTQVTHAFTTKTAIIHPPLRQPYVTRCKLTLPRTHSRH